MRRAALLCALGLLGRSGLAAAHVAPSLDDNNRYLKLTPMADRVRLAYTIYFGERPGHQLRAELDRDRDGVISDAESATLGQRLAGELATALEVTIDDARQPVTWSTIDVGLGEPTTAGGSFAVDAIGWFCTTGGASHAVRLHDRYRLPLAGETELRVDVQPGITVQHVRLGSTTIDTTATLPRASSGSALVADPWQLTYQVGAGAPAVVAACGAENAARPGPQGSGRGWWWLSLGAAIGVAGALAWTRRRRRPRATA